MSGGDANEPKSINAAPNFYNKAFLGFKKTPNVSLTVEGPSEYDQRTAISYDQFHNPFSLQVPNSAPRTRMSSPTTSNVFVYGTLMYPQVLNALINRVPTQTPARIHGYQRYAIKGQVFPGVIASTSDSTVQGILLYDLTSEEMIVFDEFEGDEYYKVGVEPDVVDATFPSVDASVYLWQDSLKTSLYGEWDQEAFREKHLVKYVSMCERFAAELKAHDKRPEDRPFGFG